jgi:hypothetical protein
VRDATIKSWSSSNRVGKFEGLKGFDKLYVMRHLGDAFDTVRKSEYARLAGHNRRCIKGQKSTLLLRQRPVGHG